MGITDWMGITGWMDRDNRVNGKTRWILDTEALGQDNRLDRY